MTSTSSPGSIPSEMPVAASGIGASSIPPSMSAGTSGTGIGMGMGSAMPGSGMTLGPPSILTLPETRPRLATKPSGWARKIAAAAPKVSAVPEPSTPRTINTRRMVRLRRSARRPAPQDRRRRRRLHREVL